MVSRRLRPPRTLPPRRPPRDQVTAHILDAAIAVFARRGFEAATMQDVAARVGMTAPALYYYFDSKQALLYEVIERNLARILVRLEEAVAAAGVAPRARLAAFVRTHLVFQLEQVERARVYNATFLGTAATLEALSPRQRTAILAVRKRIRGLLDAILADGRTAGTFGVPNPTVTAMGVLALGEFAPAWFRPGGRLSAAEVAEQCADLALRMVED